MKIALTQFAASENPADNLKKQAEMISSAASDGAKIVCTQELFMSKYFCIDLDAEKFGLAERIPSPTTDTLCSLAKKLDIVIIASLFESIFGIIACVYFIVFALSYFNDKADFTSYKVLALAPLFWAMCKMITRFMTKISFINVSELMLEMLELALVMLFFMSFAKISSDVADKGEFKKLVSYGMPAAMLAAVIGVSRLVITLCGKRDRLPSELGFSVTDPAFAFFAIVYIRHQMKHGRPESEDNAPSEDETAAKADKIN